VTLAESGHLGTEVFVTEGHQHKYGRSEIWSERMWVILLNLVHTGNLQFLAMFYNIAANGHGFLLKASKISINTLK